MGFTVGTLPTFAPRGEERYAGHLRVSDERTPSSPTTASEPPVALPDFEAKAPEKIEVDVPVSDAPTPRGESVKAGPDRGRRMAFGVLAVLVALGALLIARSARGPKGEDVPSDVAPLVDAGASDAADALDASSAVDAAASPDASVQAPTVFRVASLERDAALEVVRGTLGKHTLSAALAQAGLVKAEVRRVMHAIAGVRRIEHALPKDSFVFARDRVSGAIAAFEFSTSPTSVWQARIEDGTTFRVRPLEMPVERKKLKHAVAVTADLAKALTQAGLRDEATVAIDDALEGYGETAPIKTGIRLRVVGSEEWVDGAFADYRIDAIEYVPRGSGTPLRVYHYARDTAAVVASQRSTPHPGFYDGKGQQPYRGTFRSPVPLARITSHFNPKRLHPVLHVVMPHNGIDFGASTGTPVFAASSGTVQSAGDSGPCGNMVQLEHLHGLTTAYCHLSRFAPGLHPGQHVEARQLIGYVGQTGRVTGPHLHFAVKRSGAFIDPLALKLDGVRTLPPADREAFAKRRAELDAELDAIALPSLDGVPTGDDKDEKDEPAGEE